MEIQKVNNQLGYSAVSSGRMGKYRVTHQKGSALPELPKPLESQSNNTSMTSGVTELIRALTSKIDQVAFEAGIQQTKKSPKKIYLDSE